jgi:hypothetical protein
MLLEWLTPRKVMKASRKTETNVAGFIDKREIRNSGPDTSLNPLPGVVLHEFTLPKIPQVLVNKKGVRSGRVRSLYVRTIR